MNGCQVSQQSHFRGLRIKAALPALVALALVAVACSSQSAVSSGTQTTSAGTAPAAAAKSFATPPHLLLHTVGGAHPGFVDAQGRRVLLRGVNLNSFGDYFQAHPELPQVVPMTHADWDSMGSLGFTSIRLIVSWSFLEPTRGAFDQRYVARVKQAVREAERQGMYVVLDMHQDAWGKYIATPKDVTCPAGTTPNAGWDGAPEWATITDGASTCRGGDRESAPAVQHAFNNFYANRDGIQDEFVSTWKKLAGAFAGDPGIAGYDLLNEPNVSQTTKVIGPQYTTLLANLIKGIREGEAAAHGSNHIVFFEPLVYFPLPGTTPPAGFTTDKDIAFAPHNYWESITTGVFTIEQGYAADAATAKTWDVPYWVGEYGWWDTSSATVAKLHRNGKAEDAELTGGAWWQWKQACGDPHGLSTWTAVPPTEVVQLNTISCPGDHEEGLTPPFAALTSRAFPRAAPGRITSLTSDYDAGTMTVSGNSAGSKPGARLEVWVPKRSGASAPVVGGTGIGAVSHRAVQGGWIVTARVGCDYTLTINGSSTVAGPLTACP